MFSIKEFMVHDWNWLFVIVFQFWFQFMIGYWATVRSGQAKNEEK